MRYYEVVPSRVFRVGAGVLTYCFEGVLEIGTIVKVGVGKSSCMGVVIKEVEKPSFETKNLEVVYETALPKHLVGAISWIAEYYAVALPTVLQAVLPRGADKKRRNKKTAVHEVLEGQEIRLNADQKRAAEQIMGAESNTILLHGITGSGKTNVYLEMTRRTLERGESVILLVPEIALASQLIQNFQRHFGNTVLMHSGQTEAERHLIWEEVLKSDSPQVVVGPRSALFAPVKKLGLVIIDEAHEPSYVQDQSPKYSALRLASTMAKTVLGTATPTVADYYLCEQRKAIVEMKELAVKSDKTAKITVIDLKNRADFRKNRLISDKLLESIQASLKNHTQTMIFHNRRGSAPLTICDNCGWQALCPNCLLPMTLHADQFALLCHTCGQKLPVPTSCPECKNANINHKGFGTKSIEAELTKLFPTAKIARFDADTLPEKQMKNIYSEVKDGKYDILIGTQGIAKGFDFPKLTTLGVIQADAQLSLPDFSSEERTYQLLAQVIGRARRGHQDTEIFIQSFQPEHKAIVSAVDGDYSGFYAHALETRKKAALPPFRYLLKLSMGYKTEAAVVKNISALRQEVGMISKKVWVSVPMPAFHERTPRGYCWQILVKSASRAELLRVMAGLKPNPHLHFYLDPPTLI
ncbi:MAG: primosomal protein N' [Candidatus Saccharimonadales bacterium]